MHLLTKDGCPVIMNNKYKLHRKKVHLGFRCYIQAGPSDASAAMVLRHTVRIKDSAEGFLLQEIFCSFLIL